MPNPFDDLIGEINNVPRSNTLNFDSVEETLHTAMPEINLEAFSRATPPDARRRQERNGTFDTSYSSRHYVTTPRRMNRSVCDAVHHIQFAGDPILLELMQNIHELLRTSNFLSLTGEDKDRIITEISEVLYE
jgi:hypothetical protein